MEIKTASSRMHSLVALYDMHTSFFSKAIAGISDEDSHNRLNTAANHTAWIAGSMVHERYEMANLLDGGSRKHNADELFKNHQSIKNDAKYPPLAEYDKDWKVITPELREIYSGITDEKLDSIFEMPDMPEMKMTYFELISFMIYREANIIGQLILWRRLLGYEGIRYDEN
jgi:hypothetical protein